jgi:hypothetical protein
MPFSSYYYPSSPKFNQICSYYSLKHLQKCIKNEKDYSRIIDIHNVSSLNTKKKCIDIMTKYNIPIDDNVIDMIIGPHLKVLLLKERNENINYQTYIESNDYIIELKDQIKLEQAENERLLKKIEEYQISIENNKALEIERASHAQTRVILQKYKNRLMEIFAD